jgi:hypothetical protein
MRTVAGRGLAAQVPAWLGVACTERGWERQAPGAGGELGLGRPSSRQPRAVRQRLRRRRRTGPGDSEPGSPPHANAQV